MNGQRSGVSGKSSGRARRRAPWLLAMFLVAWSISGAAQAYWQSTDSSNYAAATADALNQASAPSTTVTAAAVALSWAATTTTGGIAVTGYTVARYPAAAGGTGTAATGDCSGTITTTGCTEQNVPGGTWYYTVTARMSLWTGAESARSTGTGIDTDTAPPTISVISISPQPNGAGYNNTSPVTVTLSATDNTGGSGVASIVYWIDAGTHTTVTTPTATISLTGNGIKTVSYNATDNANNVSTTQTQTVNIDTIAPAAPSKPAMTTATDTGISQTDAVTKNNAPTFTGTAETGSTVTLFAGPTAVGNAIAAGGTYSISTTTLTDATYSITAKATDSAGNTGPASTTTIAAIDTTNTATLNTNQNKYTYADNTSPTADTITGSNGAITSWGTDTSLRITATELTGPHPGNSYTSASIPSGGNGSFSAIPVDNAITNTSYRLVLTDTAGNTATTTITITGTDTH